jgi:hypothetical protein
LPPVNPPGSSLADYVTYTGATQNVDLGEFGVEAGFVTLDTTPTNTPTAQGTIFWDADDNTVDVVLNGYIMKIGEDLFYPVKNQTGSNIPKGRAVRFAGTLGASGRLLVAPFIADGSVPSTFFMGVTAEAIADGEDGKVLYFGRIRGMNTLAFEEGDVLYASTTTAGGFQTAVPVAPNNIVQVAAVINKSISQGVIFVRPSFGSNINQDEGVKIVSPTTGQLLQLQSNGLWENKTKAQVLGGTSSQFVKGDGTLDSNTYQVTSEKGQPNGYASLDSNGKVPLAQINDALIGNVNFQGLWNAATNTPTLANPPASGTKGYYYIVSTAGTFAGISFEVGDWIISDGTAWGKVDNTDAVSSVFGRTGNVTASNGDYTTAQVTESGNLYYTNGRARGALSFVAGSGAYNSTTGVITIPTNNNQITNGAGYITSAALGGYVQGSGSAGQVAFWSSGSAITGESNLFWDATNDRLGIGTDSPSQKLDVVGSVNLASGNSYRIDQGRFVLWNGSAFLGDIDNLGGDLYIRERGNNVITVSNGNVGIGTTSPTAKLHVVGDILIPANDRLYGNSATVTGSRSFIELYNGSTGNINLVTGFSTASIVFGTQGGTERMRITSEGNVGIGTASPESPLSIQANSTSSAIDLIGRSSDNGSRILFKDNAGATTSLIVNNDDEFRIAASTSKYIRFLTDNTERMRITSGGNVGIGTTTPSSLLTVSAISNATIRLNSTDTSVLQNDVIGNLEFYSNDLDSPHISGFIKSIGGETFGRRNHLVFGTSITNNQDAVEVMRITSGGNVLIGTTTDNVFKLDVNGTGRFTGNLTAASIIRSGGTSSQYLMADGSVSTLSNPVTGTGVNGRVAFWNGTNTITSDSDLLFNGNTLTLLTGNVEIAAGNALILFNPATTNYFQLYTNSSNEINFGFGGTTPVVAKISSAGAATFSSSVTANGLNALGSTLNNGNTLRFYRAGLFEMAYIGWSNENTNNSTWLFKSTNGNPIAFSADATNQQLIVNANGNVLIGTTTDNGGKLQVSGDILPVTDNTGNIGTSSFTWAGGQFTNLVVDSTLSVRGAIDLADNDILRLGSSDDWEFFHTSSNNYMDLNVGNLIIRDNTTTRFTFERTTGSLTATGSITATSFFESSDATIKTLVEDSYQAKGIDSVVAKLYIKNGKQELGYYAQDLEGVLPSAVSKGTDGLLNLSYREVHTAKIAYLEQRIKQLENELLKPS